MSRLLSGALAGRSVGTGCRSYAGCRGVGGANGRVCLSRLEPEEGVYEFGWLDRAVQVFTERGMDIVLCTPTCTPPQWMFHRYPEVIQVGRDGNKIPIGVRGHRCMSNLRYRDFCDKIISRMVGRYCDNPNVIGYQIDNELEANHCRCPECVSRFRKYVQGKYHTIDAVNRAYGNAVWSGNTAALRR